MRSRYSDSDDDDSDYDDERGDVDDDDVLQCVEKLGERQIQ